MLITLDRLVPKVSWERKGCRIFFNRVKKNTSGDLEFLKTKKERL